MRRYWTVVAAFLLATPLFAPPTAAQEAGEPPPAEAADGETAVAISEQALRSWEVLDLQPAELSTRPDWDVLVWDFAEINGVMYVGGRFQSVRKYSGAPVHDQPFLAAFEVDTGEWIPTFRPRFDDGVYSLAASADGTRLLVGGEFTNVNNAPLTSGFAALDPVTGEPDPDFKASITRDEGDFSVTSIVVDPATGHVYLGGRFSHLQNSGDDTPTRSYGVARLDGSTAALDRTWDVRAGGGRVTAMRLSPDGADLYLGGFFTSVNQTENTKWAAAASTTDGGTVRAFADPIDPDQLNYVFDIAVTDDRVFVATERHRLWVYDRSGENLLDVFYTSGYGGDPQALHHDGEVLWMGGHHHGHIISEVAPDRHKPIYWLAALDPTTGATIDGWIPRLGMVDGVFALTTDSTGKLWVGGDPTSSGTVPARGFAVFPPNPMHAGEVNLARGKATTQSSIGDSSLVFRNRDPEERCNRTVTFVGPPESAVDGKIAGGPIECSLAVTGPELSPWWQVDLGEVAEVDAVRLWNLTGVDDADRLADVHLAIAVDAAALDSTDPATLEANGATVIELEGLLDWYHEEPVGVYGRYVRVFLRRPVPSQLRLPEVEVIDLPEVTPAVPIGGRTIIEAGSEWRHLAAAEAAPAGWDGNGFDDTGWAAGPGPLGFGDEDIATETETGVTTTLFRHTFELDDPSVLTEAVLEFVADDGAIINLNGTEVARLRMPDGPVDANTPAAETVWGAEELAWTAATVPTNLFVAGENVLTAEVHNNWRGGGDLRFDAALNVAGAFPDEPAPVPEGEVDEPPQDVVLIDGTTSWRYLDTGVDPGPTWTTIDFDDGAWPTGLGKFGYGEGDEVTLLDEGSPSRNITNWFRTTFDIDDPADVAALDLRLLRDDGAVVHLNGVEIARHNMNDGPVTADTLAVTSSWGADETTRHQIGVVADGLVAGTNVLAVEIHSAASSSQDMSFDLTMIGLAPR